MYADSFHDLLFHLDTCLICHWTMKSRKHCDWSTSVIWSEEQEAKKAFGDEVW